MKYNKFLILIISLIFLLVIITESANTSNALEYNFHYLNGQSVNFNEYKGKYSILTFTFTRCPSICPMINYELNKLRLKYGDKINIASINVDPENDSPESLKKFMLDNTFDWDMLIGDKAEIEKVMKNMLHSDRKLEFPGQHLPDLHLMNKNFQYIQGFFPVKEDVIDLMAKLDELIE